jgi:AsmA-like C-terminal region
VGRVKGAFSIPSLQKLLASSPGGHGDALASGKFSTDKLSFAPYEITGVSATPRMFRDHIEAPITGAAYGGTVNVHARLDSSAAPSRLSANIQIAQVDLQKLMAANPSPRGTMTGHGELKLQVAAPLGGNLERSMTGQGSFALKDGKLPGMQLAKSMKELSEVERLLSLGQSGVPAVSETTYTLIGGDLEIRGARIYTNKTHLETNVGTGDMNGSVGFDQTLDLGGTWNLPKGSRAGAATAGAVGATVLTGGLLAPALFGASGAMLRIPFSVKGTLKDPKIGPGGGSSGSKGGDSQQAANQQQQQPQQKKKILGFVPKP